MIDKSNCFGYYIFIILIMIRRVFSGIIAVIGFLLSPLSWWNDLFINLPLAYLGGVFASLFFKDWFYPGILISYWLTNVLGFLMMHWGVRGFMLRKSETKKFHRKELVIFLISTIVYSILMLWLFKHEIIRLPWEYFKK